MNYNRNTFKIKQGKSYQKPIRELAKEAEDYITKLEATINRKNQRIYKLEEEIRNNNKRA